MDQAIFESWVFLGMALVRVASLNGRNRFKPGPKLQQLTLFKVSKYLFDPPDVRKELQVSTGFQTRKQVIHCQAVHSHLEWMFSQVAWGFVPVFPSPVPLNLFYQKGLVVLIILFICHPWKRKFHRKRRSFRLPRVVVKKRLHRLRWFSNWGYCGSYNRR